MNILLMGSQGSEVVALQRALNDALPSWPALTPDGICGSLTFDAVMEFQHESWLVIDGIAGPCTQNALYKTEAYELILNSPLIPLPTQTTCWAASTAMITNANVPAVIARTPADLLLADGSLANESQTGDAFTNATRFAQANNIRLVSAASSLTLGFIRTALADGPLMFDMLWEPGKYIAGTGSPGAHDCCRWHSRRRRSLRRRHDPAHFRSLGAECRRAKFVQILQMDERSLDANLPRLSAVRRRIGAPLKRP